MRLYPRSVADFYAEYMAALRSLGIEVHIYRVPCEFDDLTPFDQDQHHASYDAEYVDRFRRILIQCERVFKEFRCEFLGKCSPVHFFWGSFDLAVTRFSGRPAPQKEGVDRMTREAYSHEVTSCGFWPGDRRFKEAAFYAYSAPSPPGLDARAGAPRRGLLGSPARRVHPEIQRRPHRAIARCRRFSTSAKAPTKPGQNWRNGIALISNAPRREQDTIPAIYVYLRANLF